MAKLNLEEFSEDFREKAPKECGLYLAACLSKDKLTKLKEDWKNNGGYLNCSWWKWCLDKISVDYKN